MNALIRLPMRELPQYFVEKCPMSQNHFVGGFLNQSTIALMPNRHFPSPWSIDERAETFIVKDATGQPLGYVYFEDDPQRQMSAKRLSRDEAQRIAANMAKLPDLLRGARQLPANTAAVVKAISTGPYRIQYQALRDAQRALVAHLEAEHPADIATINALFGILDDRELIAALKAAPSDGALLLPGEPESDERR
jgi:hypothetical protein